MIERKINKRIREIDPYVAGATKEEIAKKHGLDINKVIKLASNENPFGPPPKAIEIIKEQASRVSLYPKDYPNELIKAISTYANVPENMIIPGGNGADEVMDLVIKMLVSLGDEVIVHSPTFPFYELLVKLYGGTVMKVPMAEDYSFKIDNIIDAINEKTKLIIICSPNNPTGSTISEQGLKKILGKDVLVMLDEAYIEFAEKSFTLLSSTHENLIVLRTFSKAFGLAGLRVGYGIANKEFVKQSLKIKPPHNVNLLAQEATTAALQDTSNMQQNVREIKKQRELLFNDLSNLNGLLVSPSHGNFLLITFQDRLAGSVVFELEKKGIIVRDCEGFGLKNSIRVTIGKKEENEAFLIALKEVLR
jgi:histidinol-phosphate aminotransferase